MMRGTVPVHYFTDAESLEDCLNKVKDVCKTAIGKALHVYLDQVGQGLTASIDVDGEVTFDDC